MCDPAPPGVFLQGEEKSTPRAPHGPTQHIHEHILDHRASVFMFPGSCFMLIHPKFGPAIRKIVYDTTGASRPAARGPGLLRMIFEKQEGRPGELWCCCRLCDCYTRPEYTRVRLHPIVSTLLFHYTFSTPNSRDTRPPYTRLSIVRGDACSTCIPNCPRGIALMPCALRFHGIITHLLFSSVLC